VKFLNLGFGPAHFNRSALELDSLEENSNGSGDLGPFAFQGESTCGFLGCTD